MLLECNIKLSSGQTLGVKAQRFRGHTSPHRNVKEKMSIPLNLNMQQKNCYKTQVFFLMVQYEFLQNINCEKIKYVMKFVEFFTYVFSVRFKYLNKKCTIPNEKIQFRTVYVAPIFSSVTIQLPTYYYFLYFSYYFFIRFITKNYTTFFNQIYFLGLIGTWCAC
eukprot:TRINITY_DN6149_c0_g1_i8.p2 TRINITY_DN6149_c0_g1~~TRINITY_DN6149_c0_g1_i8.p2  ORF type:complete len:164 (-),score=6.62 TRINITY_DN6149_c0_g1_i8:162-653(-)